MTRADVLVLGGGAAGLAAGIAAARAGARVCLVEKLPRVGKRLLATGNGRCNLTNTGARAADYFGDGAFAAGALARFSPEAVRAFFREIGLESREEYGGRVFPRSNQAAAVVDALRLAFAEAGGETVADFAAIALEPQRGGFCARAADGRAVWGKSAVCALGGMAAPALGGSDSGLKLMRALGHRLVPCAPALVQIKTPPEAVRALKGIRVEGQARAYVEGREAARAAGEILFADYGVSGPAVMQVSRPLSYALAEKRRAEIAVCALPEEGPGFLRARRERLAGRPLEDFLTGFVPKRLGQVLLKNAGIAPLSRPAGSLAAGELSALEALLCEWRLPALGTAGYANAQVMAGGLDTRDFDPRTLQSRKAPGLFAAGEILNVDGGCGGYNLQWAWASGLLAGSEAAKRR